ncbi:MAG: L,D-transpeptidase family protein [Epsilonproteobacteria bacterium]|nr:L,D-transpeptidase family protein [Campylobacterota bacterium]
MRLILLLTLLFTTLWSSLLDDNLQQNLQNESNSVKSLYGMNANKPLWVGHAKNFHTLMDALQNPYYNYKHKPFYRETVNQYSFLLHNDMDINANSQELSKLDIALSKSYIALANFIVQSDVDWDKVNSKITALKESKDISANWEMVRKAPPSTSQLFSALVNQSINKLFKSLTPLQNRHQALINALQTYQNMKDIPKVGYGGDLKYGDTDARIIEIKERLAMSGDFPRQAFYSDQFGDKLKRALYQYKDRFNLEQNGLIDKVTIYYFNKPKNPKIESIITNLDKLKVFPNKFPDEVIMINIPDFNMDYYKNGYSTLTMNTVVGRAERPTPIFATNMTHIVLNPTWNIPENLVRRDLITALKENPNYLKEHNMHVFKGWNGKSKEIVDFDYKKLLPYEDKSKGHIPYRFVQYPGDDNALGRIKFMFPNKYSVYLHDTDNKDLLNRRYRIYSSGCMRLQNPFRLVDALKPKFKASEASKVQQYLESEKTVTMRLKKNLPVQTTYFTVFKRNGLTYFRKDIYGYDKFIQESLNTDNSHHQASLY